MGQAGADLPDPLGARPSSGRHRPVAGGASPGSAGTALPDDAAADDLLSQLAGEEIDRLLAAADVESESRTAPRPAPAPAASEPCAAAPAPAARAGRPARKTKDQPATSRAPKADASSPRPKPATLSPGAHNLIAPLTDESDAAVRAEFDDAFEQLAGGAPPTTPALGRAANPARPEPQIGRPEARREEPPAEAALGAPPDESLGDLLEQLSAVRAEVEAEVRAEALAEARAGGAGANPAAFPHVPAVLPEADDDEGPLNLVVPESPRPAHDHPPALLPDESLDAEADGLDFDEPTTADERAGLAAGGFEAQPLPEAAPVRPAVPVPQDEETFLAEDPAPDERPSLPVRVLEWVNKPLAAFPEAVRQAVGKVAILTLINAILVLVYVLLVRG